ncbi:MAG: hypothetical protein E4G90_07440 [Gemmatimonadales bacterium]|nr:MAG: hypothetical protein E4G90_07440 [Gemmatimonadales bacterium]
MRYIILVVSLFILASATSAAAQDVLWLKPGAKVRLTVPTLGLNERGGWVQELNGDTLVAHVGVMHEGRLRLEMLHVPMSSITKLDVVTGRKGHWLEGAGIGFLIGAAIGLASGDDPSNQWFAYSAGEKALAGGLGFGLIGAGVGALIKSDKWSEVPLDRIRPRLVAQQDGVGLGVSLRF